MGKNCELKYIYVNQETECQSTYLPGEKREKNRKKWSEMEVWENVAGKWCIINQFYTPGHAYFILHVYFILRNYFILGNQNNPYDK